jgi:hypothetical protein
MTDMTDILSRPAGSIEPPKQLPPGQYLFRVLEGQTKKADGTPITSSTGNQMVVFQCQAESPVAVDADLTGIEFPVKMPLRFALTAKTAFRFQTFLVDHLQQDPQGASLIELVSTAAGKLFRGTVTHEASNQPGNNNLYASLRETFPAG